MEGRARGGKALVGAEVLVDVFGVVIVFVPEGAFGMSDMVEISQVDSR
jgi:hypothetical protein